jgi:hypothetical protein
VKARLERRGIDRRTRGPLAIDADSFSRNTIAWRHPKKRVLPNITIKYLSLNLPVESSSVTSTRRARIYGIGVDQKYQPEAQASAYPDPSMIVFML